MRLLLTRAAEDASRTRAALEARGHTVIVSPLIEIIATGTRWPAVAVAAIIATSAQAFTMCEGPAEALAHVPLYLVGRRTEEAARRRGFRGSAIVSPDADTLIANLRPHLDPSRHTVYLAGRDRKPDLEAALIAWNHRYAVHVAYEARAVGSLTGEAATALREARVDTVLHYSRRSAVLFLEAATRAALSTRDRMHLCLSEDVAGPLRAAACLSLKIAKAPNEAALLSLVDELDP